MNHHESLILTLLVIDQPSPGGALPAIGGDHCEPGCDASPSIVRAQRADWELVAVELQGIGHRA